MELSLVKLEMSSVPRGGSRGRVQGVELAALDPDASALSHEATAPPQYIMSSV